MSGKEIYNPFKNAVFSRISNIHLSNENISDGAKVILTFLGGQFSLFKDGKIETTLENIASGTGAKPILKHNITTGLIISGIPLRQTKRNIKELRDYDIIKTKKLKHGIQIEFLEGSNMSLLDWNEKEVGSNLTPHGVKNDPTEKSDHNIKNNRRMLPQGIFLKKHGDKIPPGIEGRFTLKQLDGYYEKYGDIFLKICINSKSVKLLNRAKYVQGAIKKLENKDVMKNEMMEIERSEAFKAGLIEASLVLKNFEFNENERYIGT